MGRDVLKFISGKNPVMSDRTINHKSQGVKLELPPEMPGVEWSKTRHKWVCRIVNDRGWNEDVTLEYLIHQYKTNAADGRYGMDYICRAVTYWDVEIARLDEIHENAEYETDECHAAITAFCVAIKKRDAWLALLKGEA